MDETIIIMMTKREEIESEMGAGVLEQSEAAVCRDTEVPVGSGRMCNVYRSRMHGRQVCIKRLKPEHYADPVSRTALHKEFELGFSLKHPGLPQYISEGADYVVMDYVNGHTLSALLASGGELDAKRTRQMMLELVDVVDYLHANGVVHSDIKCDNVMLALSPQRAMLLDLGLAYTDWHDTTGGDLGRFGLSEDEAERKSDADYRALGMLVQRMEEAGWDVKELGRFRKACFREGVSAEILRESLRQNRRVRNGLIAVVASVVVIGALVVAGMMGHNENREEGRQEEEPQMVEDATEASDERVEKMSEGELRQKEEHSIRMKPSGNEGVTRHNPPAENVPQAMIKAENRLSEVEKMLADGGAERLTDNEIAALINSMVADVRAAEENSERYRRLVFKQHDLMRELTDIIVSRQE